MFYLFPHVAVLEENNLVPKNQPSYLTFSLPSFWVYLVGQLIKNPPAMQETPVPFLGQEYPLEKG